MSTCCADLLELKSFQEISLIAGKNGLYRQITWPFICITQTISQWIHGGELREYPKVCVNLQTDVR